METWWLTLFHELQRSRFAEISGARASIRLPVSDQLINRVVAARLSSDGPVRSLALHALDGDRFVLRIRLAKPVFIPAFEIAFDIEQQPTLPDSPILTLRLVSGGMWTLVVHAFQTFHGLPAWISARADCVAIDLAGLAGRYGAHPVLEVLDVLRVGTEAGRIVVSAEVATPASGARPARGADEDVTAADAIRRPQAKPDASRP
jgi:hypothetical protein